MDVIRHDQIAANNPRIGLAPRRDKRIMDLRVRETLHPISGTKGEKGDRGLATEDENAFRRMPTINIVMHIRLDRSLALPDHAIDRAVS